MLKRRFPLCSFECFTGLGQRAISSVMRLVRCLDYYLVVGLEVISSEGGPPRFGAIPLLHAPLLQASWELR
jgi:hypothetical protein